MGLKVVGLRAFKNRELVATLKEMLRLAEAGSIHAHAFVIKLGPGEHRAGLSGDYAHSPAEALTATFIMEQQLSGALQSQGQQG